MTTSASAHETPKAAGSTLAPELARALGDLEKRLRAGEAQCCESVFAAYPQVAENKEALLELIYTEFVLSQELGRKTPASDWLARFPQWQADLRDLFRVDEFVSHADLAGPSACDSQAVDDWERMRAGQAELGVIGRFQLIEEIGAGGMGVVYRAQQLDLDRVVAVKTIAGGDAMSPEVRRRFRAEAEAVARLQHPHIVQIYEVGVHEYQPYFSMEYVSGGNLATHIRKHPLAALPAARLIERVARAIHFAHTQGIVHRDLKPANILLAPSERSDAIVLHPGSLPGHGQVAPQGYEPKITDFGLAKRLDNASQQTLPGAALGTPSYMAPEQAGGDAASSGAATDVYALGAVLYDVLVGRPPFHAATVHETLEQVRHADPISLRSLQPHVPRDLETICLKCLQKDPHRRYATAAALADDLERFLSGKPILARPTSKTEQLVKWTRRHPALAAFIAAIMLGAIGIGWQWYRAEAHRRAAEASAGEAHKARTAEREEREKLAHMLYAHDVSLANYEYLSNNASRARALLASCPPELRHWEWRYVQQQCQQRLREFSGFSMPVRSVAISPDGRWVAGASAIWGDNRQGEIRIWDVRTGQLKWALRGHPGPVMDVEFDPLSQRLLSTGMVFQGTDSRCNVIVWDLATGQEIWSLAGVYSHAATFSPDGRLLVIGHAGGQVTIHDAQTGERLSGRRGHQGNIYDVAFWPDGQHFVTGGRDGALKVWSIDKPEPIATWPNLVDVRRATCSPDGRGVAVATFGGAVITYDFDGQRLRQIDEIFAGDRVGGLKYTPDGQFLVVSSLNQSIRFVDPRTGRIERELHGHNGAALDVGLSRDGSLLASSGEDGSVIVWRLTRRPDQRKAYVWGPFIADFDFLNDGRQAVLAMGQNTVAGPAYDDRNVKLWDVAAGQVTKTLKGHTDWLTSVTADPHGRLVLSGSHDRSARLWDLAAEKAIHVWDDHPAAVTDVAFVREGALAVTATSDGTLRLYRTSDGKLQKEWRQVTGAIRSIAAHPQQVLIATSDPGGAIRLWRESSDAPVLTFAAHQTPIACLAFSPDGHTLAAAREDATIDLFAMDTLWAGKNITPRAILRGHAGPVVHLGFSNDSQRLASTSGDRTLKLWDVLSGQEVLSLSAVGLSGMLSRVAFSPSGEQIMHVEQNLVEIWTLRPGGQTPLEAEPDELVEWHTRESSLAEYSQAWFAKAHHLGCLAELEPQQPLHHVRHGAALARLGRYEEAARAFEAALAIRYAMSDASDLALVLLRLGDSARRERACELLWERAHETTNDRTANNLAWAFALGRNLGEHEAQIVALAERTARNTKSADAANTLGAVYLRAGRTREAIDQFDQSMKLQGGGGYPHDWALLAICHAELGERAKGEKWLADASRWLAGKDEQRMTGGPVDPLDTWDHRLELEILIQEAEEKLAQLP